MKQLFLFAATILATNTFGQIKNGKTLGSFLNTINLNATKVQESDTVLQVIYVDKNKLNQQPAYFMNGRFITNPSLPSNINPQTIENIQVLKRDTLIDNVLFRGQVYIKTKEGYSPQFITLTGLKNKYTNIRGNPAVFILDGNFVNADYDHYLVDEANLLTIIIDTLQTAKEKNLVLIKLLSKTEDNIKARKRIMIRGAD